MLRVSAVLGSLIVFAGLPVPAEEAVVRFLSPKADQVLAGETRFRFDVRKTDPPADRVDVYCGGALLGSARPPAWTLTANLALERSGAPCVAAAFAGTALLGQARLRTMPGGGSDSVSVTRVQLYPVVTDASGNHVTDLAANDFQLFEDGRPVPILHFSGRPGSLNLSLLLDVSGSMGDKLALVQAAASEFIGQFGPDEPIGVYAFNEALRVASAPTTDHDVLERSIGALEAGGSTALFDALVQVIGDLGESSGRKVIFVFSDGKDERSINSLAQAIDAAHRSDVVIYTVATIHEDDADRYRRDLKQLADSSGGQSFLVRKLGELSSVFERVTTDLRAQYVLSFVPGPGPAGVRKLQLKVRIPDRKVRVRTEYYHSPDGEPGQRPAAARRHS